MTNIVGFRRHLVESAPEMVAELESERDKLLAKLAEVDEHLAWARGVQAAAGTLPVALMPMQEAA